MIAGKKSLILRELEEGTGAAIEAAVDTSGLRSALKIWFGDLDEKHGPVAELRPFGLKGHSIVLSFGNFSGEIIDQIRRAAPEDVQLARALIASIKPDTTVTVAGQDISEWSITSGSFRMTARVRDQNHPHEDFAIIAICRDVIVPMMAAMAELIGYDVIEDEVDNEVPAFEGAVLQSVVKRRERNPRNRLLCIRIHGERCLVCGLEPRRVYGDAGTFIEVHHLEPLASLTKPRPYDPRTDLVPLCPNCHRALHTRRPIPLSIEELKALRDCYHD
ncbi:HNH endonuclease [Pseudomonas sp. Marseille-P9899]|uniref:HNH endonuclease n=1 Tax=Pseudomonas sp. Marseille-P9899 TaxID=2730401 RepID=UPI0015899567|nr:HNH endonuclease [Pseudomonas sp. Marseille-P9899]